MWKRLCPEILYFTSCYDSVIFQVYNLYMQTRRSVSHRTENQDETYKIVISHRQYCNYAIWGDSAHLWIILKKSKPEIAYFMFNRALLRGMCFVYSQQQVPSACSTDNRFHMFWDMNTKNKDRMMTSYEFDNQLCILRIVHRTTHQAISQTYPWICSFICLIWT